MSRGEPLTDEDRGPWLGEIGSRLAEAESTLIVGCSSLNFMPTDLIESQFATLEPPGVEEDAITVNVAKPLEAIVDQIVVFFDAR